MTRTETDSSLMDLEYAVAAAAEVDVVCAKSLEKGDSAHLDTAYRYYYVCENDR